MNSVVDVVVQQMEEETEGLDLNVHPSHVTSLFETTQGAKKPP